MYVRLRDRNEEYIKFLFIRNVNLFYWANSDFCTRQSFKFGLKNEKQSNTVPGTGLEPAQHEPYAPQAYVSTNFTTRAIAIESYKGK